MKFLKNKTLDCRLILCLILLYTHFASCNKNRNMNTNTNLNSAMNMNTNHNQMLTSSETNEGAFVTGKFLMKMNKKNHNHKKVFAESQATTTLPPTSSGAQPGLTANEVAQQGKLPTTSSTSDVVSNALGQGELTMDKAIIYATWVKFFKFKQTEMSNDNTPKQFFLNTEYRNQYKLNPNINLDEKDNEGMYKYIRDKTYFYATLFKNRITFLSSRQRELHKVFDDIAIEEMGKVSDFGNFSEGYCFKIKEKGIQNYNWIICADLMQNKLELMQKIEQLRFEAGVEDDDEEDNHGHNSNTRRRNFEKNSGTCSGDSSSDQDEFGNGNGNVNGASGNSTILSSTLAPIVKEVSFSKKPQRYSKCLLKETDAFVKIRDKTTLQFSSVPFPSRIVMNNQTFSIFKADEYESLAMVLNLQESKFRRSKEDKSCFIVIETELKSAEICPLEGRLNKKFIEEWDYDFNLFKFQCHSKRDVVDSDSNKGDLNGEMAAKLKEKIDAAKRELLAERMNQIKKKQQEEEEVSEGKVIIKTQEVAMKALKKEITIEEKIKQEEKERESAEEAELMRQIEEEKKKKDCILKAINEKKLENQYNLNSQELVEEVKKIKKKTEEEVIVKRNELKDSLKRMREKAKIRKEQLRQKLMEVRSSVAGEMKMAYKKGDHDVCLQGKIDGNVRQNFCVANIKDVLVYQGCMNPETFCHVCCDNQIGDIHMEYRVNVCYSACDSKNEAKVTSTSPTKGSWIWHPEDVNI